MQSRIPEQVIDRHLATKIGHFYVTELRNCLLGLVNTTPIGPSMDDLRLESAHLVDNLFYLSLFTKFYNCLFSAREIASSIEANSSYLLRYIERFLATI